MKRLRIILLVFCALLLIVWPLRWEKGPTQTEKGLKIIHLRDRWNDQRWTEFYGEDGDKFYSGERVPYISEKRIIKLSNIILTTIGEKRKHELEKQLEEAIQKKLQHDQGYKQYLQLEEQLKKDFQSQHLPKGPFGKLFYEFDYGLEQQHYVRSKMPQKLIKAYDAWQEASRTVLSLNRQINRPSDWAREEAKKGLIQQAYRDKDVATAIWAAFVGLSFIGAVVLHIWERLWERRSQNHPQDLSQQ